MIAHGRAQAGIPVLEQSVRLSPGSLAARKSLALAYERSQRLDDAIVALQGALRLAVSNGAKDDAAAVERLIRATRDRRGRR